jgi:hypothetical protein
VLHPQFVGRRDGRSWMYFDQADAHAVGFVGWLPYKPLAWDISLSKPAFKALALQLGLRTPALHASDAAQPTQPCLIKRARGAFGIGMRGPFAPEALAEELAQRPLQAGEYLESFVWGRIARAWYWSGQLTVLELFDMPRVQGDGRSHLGDLLERRSTEASEHLPAIAPLLRLQGVDIHTVPASGQPVVCDYRYVSPFNPTVYANSNVLRQPASTGSAVVQAFSAAGRALWPHIPAPQDHAGPGRQAGFVLDAIVDANDQAWLLEINSNAQGHPDGYAAMLDALCSPMALDQAA